MLTNDQLIVLRAAAKLGWYSVMREYNAPWPLERSTIEQLEAAGWMKFESLERNPLTQQMTRKYALTDRGKEALERAINQPPQPN